MDLLTQTLDIRNERDQAAESVADVESQIEAKVDEAMALDPPQDAEEQAQLDSLEEDVAELEGQLATTRGYYNALERAVDEWDGNEIVLRELSGAETRAVSVQAQQKAEEQGMDYSESFHETMFLKKATYSTPPGAPDPEAIGDLPNRLFDWVLSRANMLNSVGAFEMGNSSLRERMLERDSQDSQH